MIRALALASACLALVACADSTSSSAARSTAGKTPPANLEHAGNIDLAALEKPGCYTVDLFDDPTFNRPGPDVPAEHARYIGNWDGGMWGGEWCHDLIVTRVDASGRVEMLDMHAPYMVNGSQIAPASIFKRVGQIQPDGSLVIRYGSAIRTYRFSGEKLIARRAGDRYGDMRAVLARTPY